MYIFYKLIKFHKLVYRTLKIVTIETNIFFINLAEGYPPIPPISTEYGRNKSRLVSTLDHDSLGSENKISLPIPLRTSKGASEQIDRKFVTLIISFLFSPLVLLPYPSVPRLLHAREQPGVWPDGILMGHTASPHASSVL